MWTVLSATIMFADKPHRSTNELARSDFVFDDLPPVTALAVGLPAQRLSRSDFVLWHETDIPTAVRDVRSQGKAETYPRSELFRF